jgi:hypothetical protein
LRNEKKNKKREDIINIMEREGGMEECNKIGEHTPHRVEVSSLHYMNTPFM